MVGLKFSFKICYPITENNLLLCHLFFHEKQQSPEIFRRCIAQVTFNLNNANTRIYLNMSEEEKPAYSLRNFTRILVECIIPANRGINVGLAFLRMIASQ